MNAECVGDIMVLLEDNDHHHHQHHQRPGRSVCNSNIHFIQACMHVSAAYNALALQPFITLLRTYVHTFCHL